uniref:Uncharacterized protein n=1 Tax=Sphaerodactylus townsendi TaxID=933632 RepID=A0ACB8FLA0_9SAUR
MLGVVVPPGRRTFYLAIGRRGEKKRPIEKGLGTERAGVAPQRRARWPVRRRGVTRGRCDAVTEEGEVAACGAWVAVPNCDEAIPEAGRRPEPGETRRRRSWYILTEDSLQRMEGLL